MAERWRRELAKLDRLDPDAPALRRQAEEGPQLPDPVSPSPGSRLVAGAVALVLALGAIGVAVVALGLRDEQTASAPVPSDVCGYTSHADPSYVGLLGRELPRSLLDQPGFAADDVEGPAGDALRAYLATPAAEFAPSDGWRPLVEEAGEVVFGAPDEPGEWFVVGFTLDGGEWLRTTEMLDHEVPTAAQRGAGLHLEWAGPLEVVDGVWQTTLELVNDRDDPWVDAGGEHWASARVFDPATGEPIRAGDSAFAGIGHEYRTEPGGRALLPIAISRPDELPPGEYDIVACVDDLALASPVGTMEVAADGSVPDVTVLTYAPTGFGMDALGGGVLSIVDGCLAVETPEDGSHQFVLWPAGWRLVTEGEGLALVDATGDRVAAVGDRITFGGGSVGLPYAQDLAMEPIHERCHQPGKGYFVTSGEIVEVVPGG